VEQVGRGGPHLDLLVGGGRMNLARQDVSGELQAGVFWNEAVLQVFLMGAPGIEPVTSRV
jgi:hypothetical protein